MDNWICPCGATLISQEKCLASEDELLRHVGEAYLTPDSGYCAEEDDVVPYAWAFKSEEEQQEHWRRVGTIEVGNPFEEF